MHYTIEDFIYFVCNSFFQYAKVTPLQCTRETGMKVEPLNWCQNNAVLNLFWYLSKPYPTMIVTLYMPYILHIMGRPWNEVILLGTHPAHPVYWFDFTFRYISDGFTFQMIFRYSLNDIFPFQMVSLGFQMVLLTYLVSDDFQIQMIFRWKKICPL